MGMGGSVFRPPRNSTKGVLVGVAVRRRLRQDRDLDYLCASVCRRPLIRVLLNPPPAVGGEEGKMGWGSRKAVFW